ncbi:MAG: formylglycine-generating enzyme family protein [Gemmataceae bacterium]|nr:formylglycine-generating enzyme family protein [Gemmataceae bacterium]
MPRIVVAVLVSCLAALPLIRRAPGAAQNPPDVVVDKLQHKGYTEHIKGDEAGEAKGFEAKWEMVPIPGGTFLMGSPDNEPGRQPDEGPQHWVTVRPFWMSKTEVTWDEYEVWLKEMGVNHWSINEKRLKADPDAFTGPTPAYVDQYYGHGAGRHPALCMTHHAACEYCRWLSKRTGKIYRLPTEAEWEWACRAGTKTAYFFGDDPKDLRDYAWYIKNAAPSEDEEPKTHPVATRKPNPWGLYDMYGNVAEWCLDHYDKNYYQMMPKDKPALWPVLLPTERRFSHVVRGGSWHDDAPRLRSAARVGSTPEWIKLDPQRPQSVWWLTQWDYVGFRIVRPVEEQDNLKGFRSKVTRQSPD